MIHSANSRLLNCSSLIQKLNPNIRQDYPISNTPQLDGELYSRSIVKLEPVNSPLEPSSPESSISNSFPNYAASLTSPHSRSAPSSVGSWSSNALLPDFDIDLPDMCDDSDPCGFSINDQELTSIKGILEQTFKNGRDVFDVISTVY